MEIKKILYRLYKIQWLYDHNITYKDLQELFLTYYREQKNEDIEQDMTFEEYIEEFGFDGVLYVSYEEFLGEEFRDEEAMVGMLNGDEELILEYRCALASVGGAR